MPLRLNLDAIERASLEYKHADKDDEEGPTVRSYFYVIAAAAAASAYGGRAVAVI